MNKAILFDVDGVLTLHAENFSAKYARDNGLAEEAFAKFFKESFPLARRGEADLKDLIAENQDVWRYDGDIDDLLTEWFEFENLRNEEVLEIIAQIRQQGIVCCLATNQEAHRGNYLKNVMFKNEFDDYFVSAFLGADKPDPQFYQIIMERLKGQIPDLASDQIVYFDDELVNVEAAQKLGIQALQYTGVKQLRALLTLY